MEKADNQSTRLAGLLRDGDADAPRLLFETYHAPLHAYCARMLGDRDEADDATQETFLAALSDISGLRSPGKLREWLFGIARHRVSMKFRARRGGLREPLTEELWHDTTPLTIAEENDTRAHVRSAVAALAPPFREMVILRDYNQFSYAEIAALTGLTEDVVRSRLHRARQALVRKLAPIFDREDTRELRNV